MGYKQLLRHYIKSSGLLLREISRRCKKKETPVSQAYISNILNDETLPPPSDDISRILAEVTGGNPEDLIMEGHIDKLPDSIRTKFEADKREIVKRLVKLDIKMSEKFSAAYDVGVNLDEMFKSFDNDMTDIVRYISGDKLENYEEWICDLSEGYEDSDIEDFLDWIFAIEEVEEG